MSECLSPVRVNGALGLVHLPKCRHLASFKLPWASPLPKRSGRSSTGCRGDSCLPGAAAGGQAGCGSRNLPWGSRRCWPRWQKLHQLQRELRLSSPAPVQTPTVNTSRDVLESRVESCLSCVFHLIFP